MVLDPMHGTIRQTIKINKQDHEHYLQTIAQYQLVQLILNLELQRHTNTNIAHKKKHLQDEPYASNQRYGTPKESTHKAKPLSNPMQNVSQLILLGGNPHTTVVSISLEKLSNNCTEHKNV